MDVFVNVKISSPQKMASFHCVRLAIVDGLAALDIRRCPLNYKVRQLV